MIAKFLDLISGLTGKKLLFFILAGTLLWSPLYAQIPYVAFNGSLSLSNDFYSASGIEARRPGNQSRGMLNANFTLFDQVILPFQFSFSTNQSNFQQPFNQFGVNPRIFKWLTLHGGYFSAKMSDLTFGDLRVYGGGMELTPGDFRVKVLYGRTKDVVNGDSVRNIPATYRQKAFAAQLGYGKEGESYININVSRVWDDTASIVNNTTTSKPAENLAVSDQFGIRFSRVLSMTGELGASLYSSNIHAEKADDLANRIPSFFFTPRLSTQIDGAGLLAFNITPSEYWSLALTGKWIGPGFVTLGYAQMPNDLMEYTANPSLRLLDNRLNITGSIGIRQNNLRNNKLNTSKGFTGMTSIDYQVNSFFGVNCLYNQNQIKSDNKSDLTKISNVFNMLTLSPRIMFQGLGGSNSVIFTFSYQDSQDDNSYLQQTQTLDTTDIDPIEAIIQHSRNQTRSYMAAHTLSLPSSLTASTSLFYTCTSIPNGSIQIANINENIGHQFLDNRLGLTLGLGYSTTHYVSTNGQFIVSFNASYSLQKLGSVNFSLSNSRYRGGSQTPSYSELQGNLQYTINI